MKKLTIIRHAKSSWKEEAADDWSRPLKKRGKEDATIMAREVLKDLPVPQMLFSSTAKRAATTASIIMKELDLSQESAIFTDSLYTFSWYDLLDFLRKVEEPLEDIWIFGHNPALTDLINYLSFEKKLLNLQTAAICRLHLEADTWEGIFKECGTMELYHFPKEFRENHENHGDNE